MLLLGVNKVISILDVSVSENLECQYHQPSPSIPSTEQAARPCKSSKYVDFLRIYGVHKESQMLGIQCRAHWTQLAPQLFHWVYQITLGYFLMWNKTDKLWGMLGIPWRPWGYKEAWCGPHAWASPVAAVNELALTAISVWKSQAFPP